MDEESIGKSSDFSMIQVMFSYKLEHNLPFKSCGLSFMMDTNFITTIHAVCTHAYILRANSSDTYDQHYKSINQHYCGGFLAFFKSCKT